jgi:hypothetical protein
MSEPFLLNDPEDAREYLASLDAQAQIRGEKYFRQGHVGGVMCSQPGKEFAVVVQGSLLYQVTLYRDPLDGWLGECSCPQGGDCKHTYAAMKSLLAEHSLAQVRGMSSGELSVSAPGQHDKPRPATPAGSFAQQVAAALGRSLVAQETVFLRKLSEVYTRCSTTRRISNWDLEDLGLHPGGYSWDVLRIWPAFPPTEHEFWLYIAHALRERGRAYPDFLEPVTDLTVVKERLLEWQRGERIDQWKQTFQHLQTWNPPDTAEARGLADLRLVLADKQAWPEWLRPGQAQFARLKPTPADRLEADLAAGLLELPSDADLLWQSLRALRAKVYGTDLRYDHPEVVGVLGRLLRHPALASRLVTVAGQPLQRVTDPLRWAMTTAGSAQEDYSLRLVQADGAPAPHFLFTVAGQPPLYVTETAVFVGPRPLNQILHPDRENRIPAPAVESRAGVEFLHKLGLQPPPRLRERIRHVALEPFIRCELRPSHPGSKTENCFFQVRAVSPDGAQEEHWNGQSWVGATTPALTAKKERPGETITFYDRAALAAVPRQMEPLDLKSEPYGGGLYLRVSKQFPETFAAWLKTVPPTITVQLVGELASLAQAAVSGRVRLEASEAGIDWFDLRVVLDVTDTTLSPAELKLLLNAKGGFVRLGDKGWRRLQFDLTEEEDGRLARLGLNPHELTAEPQRLHALQLADEAAKKFLPEEQVAHIQRRAAEIQARVTPDVPAGITGEMRPYQREGFHFLAYLATNRFGGILADDMGLGKTLQTLAWLLWLRELNGAVPAPAAPAALAGTQADAPAVAAQRLPLPSLVVCPKSVMDNWHAEAARFAPGLRVKVWHPEELKSLLDRRAEADLHVLNYSQLRGLGESLAPAQWLAVILDEGQYIKNPNSQTAQVARSLRSEHRLILSGTPIENRLLDLWSLMTFAMPGVLCGRTQFARLFDSKEDPFARRRLAARVRPFLLRRTKTQVAKDLPDRVEEDLYCELEGEQKALYRAELKRAQQMLLRVQTQKQLAKERFSFLTSLLRLRQVCCHPALVKPDSKAPGAKLEALLEQLEPLMEEGHKVLVFSQFVELLNLVQPVLVARGWPVFYLAGHTENRGDLVREFQAAEGAGVFLISLKAGGFGLNLTAASYVVLFDPWWNPAVENQAIDRTHRIGQQNKVMAYRLLIKDSIEEKIRLLQKQKSALADDVLGEEKFAQALTLDDLQFLFAD